MAYDLDKIRNIGIIAHIDAGKTTTTERLLYYSGTEHRAGDVDMGNTKTDWMPAERERGITITSAAVSFEWAVDGVPHRFNLIDTPGHVDFTAEVERSLRVLDGAVFVFCGVAGVQAQSETVWRQANRYHVPCIAYINKLDRAGADFERAVQSIENRLKANAVPIQLPVHDDNGNITGVIDLIERDFITWPGADDKDDMGQTVTRGPVPADSVDIMEAARDLMLERLGDVDDRIAEAFLSGSRVPSGLIREAVRKGTIAHPQKIVPVLCGSSLKNRGVQPLMDAVVHYLPAPNEVTDGIIKGINPKSETEAARKLDRSEAFSALAFKTFVTKNFELTYLRVYSGKASKGEAVLNATKNKKERLSQMWLMYAMDRQPLETIEAGQIVAITGLQDTVTGDTLCNPNAPILFEKIQFPHTVVQMAIEAKSSADKDKLDHVLRVMEREDPTFSVKIDPDSGQQLVGGMGELHLEVIRDRMKSDFNLDTNVGKPTVSYKETVLKVAEEMAEYSRSTAQGSEIRAAVKVRIEPAPDVAGVVVANTLTKADLPLQYHGPILAELKSAVENGGNYGYPVIQARVTLVGATFYEGQSNEIAFIAAASQAVRQAMEKAGSQLLEPIMRLTVETPDEFIGDIQRDLNRRRVDINDMQMENGLSIIKGTAPIAEMFGYANSIRAQSQGRATYSMEPFTYRPVPEAVQAKFTF